MRVHVLLKPTRSLYKLAGTRRFSPKNRVEKFQNLPSLHGLASLDDLATLDFGEKNWDKSPTSALFMKTMKKSLKIQDIFPINAILLVFIIEQDNFLKFSIRFGLLSYLI